MKNGKIIVGIEKERLTKIKHDGFNDNDAIRYCLNAAGITFKDVYPSSFKLPLCWLHSLTPVT
ncbi:carbamoyltransferase N-terminal domain-containing protein [Photorhabdus sp. S10-54]|uniref:carbamoyltransferase N-terminal domain-containing protein n=2 Tax=Morganellaceae TaxID=1903414 RepID=UPI00403F423B